MNTYSTFLFIITALGTLSGIRIFHFLRSREWFAETFLTKIGTACVGLFFYWLIKSDGSIGLLILTFTLIFLLLIGAYWTLKRRHEILLESGFESFLGQLSVTMKRGESFRVAMAKILAEQPRGLRGRLQRVWEIVYFSQHSEAAHLQKLDRRMLQILGSLDAQSYAVVKRCDFFRQQIQVERKFRQRSGDLLWQPRYQAGVLTIFYLILVIAAPTLFGPRDFLPYLFVSGTLFGIGIVLLFNMGKRFRWTW